MNNETIDKIKKSGWRDVEIFSWKTIALYVQLIDLKDHLEVCLPSCWSFKAAGQPKFKVVFHENDSNSIISIFRPKHTKPNAKNKNYMYFML